MAVGAVMKAVQAKHHSEVFDIDGHSMGGYIGTKVAEYMPTKVRSLTLTASAGLNKHSYFTDPMHQSCSPV